MGDGRRGAYASAHRDAGSRHRIGRRGHACALDRLDVGPPVDVVLLDMLLPVLDGWHFLKRLRAAPGGAPPIIVTTVREDVFIFNKDLKDFRPNQVSPFDDFMNVDI